MIFEDDQFKVAVKEVCSIVERSAGIHLPPSQYEMISSRLKTRLSKLGLDRIEDYMRHLRQNYSEESKALVSLMTTHFTSFFRESIQFEFLADHALPRLIETASRRPDKTIRIWSAACSRGHEVYTLAMFFDYHLRRLGANVSFEVLGSDIDDESLAVGKNGVYHMSELAHVPSSYLGSNWAKGTGDISDFVKAKQSLMTHISWEQINLNDMHRSLAGRKFDIIFCRNVLIYFTRDQARKCFSELAECVNQGGFVLLGVSESMDIPAPKVSKIGPSVFQVDPHPKTPLDVSDILTPKLSDDLLLSTGKLMRVVCIDDSPTILKMLQGILSDKHGFIVVGTASNGIIGAEVVAQLRPDVVTLDIHMPEMDGIAYLDRHMSPLHPPVVVISSVARQDASLAFKALKLGARDYVEKPTITTLSDSADEIRSKLRFSRHSIVGPMQTTTFDQSVSRNLDLRNPADFLRIVIAGPNQIHNLNVIISNLQGQQPPLLVLLDGSPALLEQFATEIKSFRFKVLSALTSFDDLRINQIGVMSFKSFAQVQRLSWSLSKSVALVLGQPSPVAERWLKIQDEFTFILDEHLVSSGVASDELMSKAFATLPVTSMAYVSSKVLIDFEKSHRG